MRLKLASKRPDILLLATLITVCFVQAFYNSMHVPILFTMGLSIVTCFYYCIVRRNDVGLWFLFCGLISLRMGLAYYDAEVKVLTGGDKDALMFHRDALIYLAGQSEFTFLNGSALFKVFLSKLYAVFGSSRFVSNIASTIASLVALVAFYECLLILNGRKAKTFLLIFGVLPSFLLFSSITMREAYLTAFVLVFTCLCLKALTSRHTSILTFSAALLSTLLLPLLHVKAFYIYGLLVAVTFIAAFSLIRRSKLRVNRKRALIVITICMLSALTIAKGREFLLIVNGYSPYLAESEFTGKVGLFNLYSITELSDYLDGLGSYLESTGGQGDTTKIPRTAFITQIDMSSVGSFVQTGSLMFLQYMFEPVPWRLNGISQDLIPMGEALIRFFCVLVIGYFFIKIWLNRNSIQSNDEAMNAVWMSVFLFTIYVLQCAIWSVATTNYGQAFRHHTSSTPLLLLCFYNTVIQFFLFKGSGIFQSLVKQ